MTKKRDIPSEIIEIRSRQKYGVSFIELLLRRYELDRLFASQQGTDSELMRYFPVALVACIEMFFRLSVQELIDAGEPYFSRAEKIANGVKLDFNALSALQSKKVTIGELISHSLPWSNIRNIDSNMTTLLDTNFLKATSPMLSSPDTTFASVSRLFEIRHIICHEIASNTEMDPAEITQCYTQGVAFLEAANQTILNLRFPDTPRTQSEINQVSAEMLQIAEQELEDTQKNLIQLLSTERVNELQGVDRAWRHYIELAGRFSANEAKGGSIWSALYHGTTEMLVRERTLHLADMANRLRLLNLK